MGARDFTPYDLSFMAYFWGHILGGQNCSEKNTEWQKPCFWWTVLLSPAKEEPSWQKRQKWRICIPPTKNNGFAPQTPQKRWKWRKRRVSLRQTHGLPKTGFFLPWTAGDWLLRGVGAVAEKWNVTTHAERAQIFQRRHFLSGFWSRRSVDNCGCCVYPRRMSWKSHSKIHCANQKPEFMTDLSNSRGEGGGPSHPCATPRARPTSHPSPSTVPLSTPPPKKTWEKNQDTFFQSVSCI